MVIGLDGDGWQLRGCLGREWETQVGPDKPWDAPGWLPARVPGSVIDDLWRAGEVPDPYHERNSLQLEWVPERSWVYRRWVDVVGDGGTIAFEGVDHAATVFVDGDEVAQHAGMFRAFDVEVPRGRHLLAVVVHPAPENEPQIGRTSDVRVHKSRMGYGWDFCPRMVHQGIWRPVTLHVGGRAPDSFPRVTLSPDLSEGVVHARGPLTLVDGQDVVATGEDELRVESPELWWPNGMGAQHLYRLRAGAQELAVGFRHLADGFPYTAVVNGVRMDVKGWNWVPLDALYGVPRSQKLAHLLELAARANVNVIRVWGGGLIESDEFYDLCDRLGLLVWQEFSMSASGEDNAPADDPEFVRLMVDDAREIVPRRRHHASLALWCGGNELADGEWPVLEALRDVVRELDSGRAWLPTSPAGADETHGPWEHQGLRAHYELYDAGTWRLHSEFGVEGMTNRRALAALVTPEHRWPADRTNAVYGHLGAWWNNAPLVQEAFGGRIRDVETMRRASQFLQYEGLRYAVEANLRRGSGTIPWQFNESYPNAWCTSAVDHRGDPKPAYYAVARAYRPDCVSASFATCAWGGEAEVRARIHGDVIARIVDVHGRVRAESAAEIAAPLDALTDVFLLDLGRSRYVMTRTENLAPLLDLEPASVEIDLDDAAVTLRNAGGVAAIGIVLEDARPYDAPGWTVFEDNMIALLPGESRTIGVEWPEQRELLVEGWNVRG